MTWKPYCLPLGTEQDKLCLDLRRHRTTRSNKTCWGPNTITDRAGAGNFLAEEAVTTLSNTWTSQKNWEKYPSTGGAGTVLFNFALQQEQRFNSSLATQAGFVPTSLNSQDSKQTVGRYLPVGDWWLHLLEGPTAHLCYFGPWPTPRTTPRVRPTQPWPS